MTLRAVARWFDRWMPGALLVAYCALLSTFMQLLVVGALVERQWAMVLEGLWLKLTFGLIGLGCFYLIELVHWVFGRTR